MQDHYIYVVGKPDPSGGYIKSIHKLGYRVGILLDSRASLKNPEEFDRVEVVDFSKFDDELTRLDGLGLMAAGFVCTYENYIISKAKLGKIFHLSAPSIKSAMISTDKLLMRQSLMDKDPSITPQFQKIDSLDQAVLFADQHGYPLIIKPTNLVKSLLVMKCRNKQELIANFNYAHNNARDLYKKFNIYDRAPQLIIEQFIDGAIYSIAAFVDHSGAPHFCDGVTGLTSAQDIGVDDNYLCSRLLPADLDKNTEKKLFNTARKGIEAMSLRSTPAHVELIYTESGVKIIEIGARIGGYRPRMYKDSYDLDLVEQEVRLSLGKRPQLNGRWISYSAVYELFPDFEGAFLGINESVNTSGYKYFAIKAKPGQMVGPSKKGYKASAIIMVVSDDLQKFKMICKSVDNLSVVVSK